MLAWKQGPLLSLNLGTSVLSCEWPGRPQVQSWHAWPPPQSFSNDSDISWGASLRCQMRHCLTRLLHIARSPFLHQLSAILLTPHIPQLLKHIQGHSLRNNMLILHLKLLLAKLGPGALWKHPEERNPSQWHTLFNLMNYASRWNVLLQPMMRLRKHGLNKLQEKFWERWKQWIPYPRPT